jgi:hypothetical protein
MAWVQKINSSCFYYKANAIDLMGGLLVGILAKRVIG